MERSSVHLPLQTLTAPINRREGRTRTPKRPQRLGRSACAPIWQKVLSTSASQEGQRASLRIKELKLYPTWTQKKTIALGHHQPAERKATSKEDIFSGLLFPQNLLNSLNLPNALAYQDLSQQKLASHQSY